jgi:hypothetical protein
MYRKFDVTGNLFFCIVYFSMDLNKVANPSISRDASVPQEAETDQDADVDGNFNSFFGRVGLD